jgi:hypothetical protein
VPRHFLKTAAITIQNRPLAHKFLIAADDDVGVLRINLHQARLSPHSLAANQGGARAGEQIHHPFPPPAAIADGPLDQLDGFGRGMVAIGGRLVCFPQSGLRLIPIPAVLLASNVAVEDGLVLGG